MTIGNKIVGLPKEMNTLEMEEIPMTMVLTSEVA